MHDRSAPPNRTLYVCDNLPVLRGINSECIDLIATDPPFNTKRQFNAPMGSKAAGQKFNDRWRWDDVTGEWHDLIATDYPAIKELIEAAVVIEGGKIDSHGGIDTGRIKNSIAAFLVWMAPRLIEMRRVLKPTGSIYLHCDPTASHFLKLLMDSIFGRRQFRNEITWRRTNATKYTTRGLPKNSDTILRYSRSKKFVWNVGAVTIPHDIENPSEEALKRFNKMDADGRRYYHNTFMDPTQNPDSLCTYEIFGITRTWQHKKETIDKLIAEGRIIQTNPGRIPVKKFYLDESPGQRFDDIWTDVTNFSVPKELTGWKTQKPLNLYERIIKASSNEGDIVLDPFAGCATTCVAAERLSRKWIGIDIDPVAEEVTKERLYNASGISQEESDEFVTVKTRPPHRTDIESISADRMRLILWKRQGRKCANPYCSLVEIRKEDVHLDHIIPRSRGGEDDLENRMALCGNCNMRKGRKAWGLFLDEERSKQVHPVVRA